MQCLPIVRIRRVSCARDPALSCSTTEQARDTHYDKRIRHMLRFSTNERHREKKTTKPNPAFQQKRDKQTEKKWKKNYIYKDMRQCVCIERSLLASSR